MSDSPATAIAAVIPCYNGALFLAEAIDSALSQTRPVARIVVADDGSTDDSYAIAESYAARGLPVVCLRVPTNRGPSFARNLALAHVREPYVAFLDADDVWSPTHCVETAALLDRFPEAVLASGNFRTFDATERLPPVFPVGQPFDARVPLFITNIVQQSATVVRREALVTAGGYAPEMRFAEDFDLWLRLARLGPFVGTGSVSCYRRRHPGAAIPPKRVFNRARCSMGAGARASARMPDCWRSPRTRTSSPKSIKR
jgi:glycosyltransferase involved in cell wall biosynthesis